MDTGLRLVDVLVVLLDYLGWWSYPVLEMKLALVQFAAEHGYKVITWQ